MNTIIIFVEFISRLSMNRFADFFRRPEIWKLFGWWCRNSCCLFGIMVGNSGWLYFGELWV